MEQKRNERLPGAIALLIVVFTCVIALVAGRIITSSTRRSGYDFKSVSIPAALSMEVVDDGFIYYDGSSIAAVTTEAKVKWSYLIGKNADFFCARPEFLSFSVICSPARMAIASAHGLNRGTSRRALFCVWLSRAGEGGGTRGVLYM